MSQQLDALIGSSVYDPEGDKIGRVKRIYIDNSSGAPTWVAVSTGLFSGDSLVPLAGAQYQEDYSALQVRVEKDAVKNAPHLEREGLITPEAEQELFAHYHVDPANAGMDVGQQPASASGQAPSGTSTSGMATAAGTGVAGTAAAGTAARGKSDQKERTAEPKERAAEPMQRMAEPTAQGNQGEMIRSEERLNVDTHQEAVGKARVRKYVVTENQSVTVPTTHEEVRVEREPITDPSSVGKTHMGDQEQEVILHEDQVRVSKEEVPVERVRLAVDEVHEDKTVSDTVRKERIEAEGVETDPKKGPKHRK
ncbi:PRC and DUF2382 domain-containing protein [Nocardia callitridis]|uniref:PRC and DUF2382 domain-containing protein n=1 Tax=Nocardia callitridis TaxID=648753 RepID=A0ABP9KEV4_9NOCA